MYAIFYVLLAIFHHFIASFTDKYGKRPHLLILDSLLWKISILD